MRGITSNVDIVWSRDGTVVNDTTVTATTMDNSSIYTNSYTIPLLRTSDNGVMYECRLVIHRGLGVSVSDTVSLNVIGKCFIYNGYST